MSGELSPEKVSKLGSLAELGAFDGNVIIVICHGLHRSSLSVEVSGQKDLMVRSNPLNSITKTYQFDRLYHIPKNGAVADQYCGHWK
jgi:hypothetical protein